MIGWLLWLFANVAERVTGTPQPRKHGPLRAKASWKKKRIEQYRAEIARIKELRK